jgi:hypothetical protein
MVGGTISVPTMGGTMNAKGGLQYKKGDKVVRVSSYVLTHKGGKATLTAIVNGHRTVIATMSPPKTHMTATKGTMSGGLHISAVWAKLINKLVGIHVVQACETIGQLSMTIKMS